MIEFGLLVLLVLLGGCAGFINVVAGGGSMLTLPVMISLMHMEGDVANGTNRVAILIQNISAVFSFKKEGYGEFKQSFLMFLCCFPGVVIGAIFANHLDPDLFKQILGVLMFPLMILMLRKPKTSKLMQKLSFFKNPLTYIGLFIVGCWNGFIQAGVGLIFMLILSKVGKMSLLQTNMHKVFVILCCSVIALGIFAWHGHVDWGKGLALSLGNATGAACAAKMSVRKGEGFIRIFMVIAMAVLGIKLLAF